MERFAVEPDSIDGASKSSPLPRVEQSAMDTARTLPLLEGVYVFPTFGYPPDVYDCLHERETERGSSDQVSRLAGVVGHKLNDVFKRTIGSVQCKMEKRQLVNSVDCVKALGGAGKS